MTREEALTRYDRIRYNLLNSDDKAAVDVAFEALRERGNCCKNGNSSWISVEDRLPHPYTEVLAYRKNHSREGGFATLEHLILWHDETLVWNNDTTTWRSKVTHWMPLPEPPEVEG